MSATHATLLHSNAEPGQLAAWLKDSYRLTLGCHEDLDGSAWIGPYLPIVNPPQWELGHVAWFLERWCLRRPAGEGALSMLMDAEALYDSSRIAHVARWFLPLPSPQRTLEYLAEVTGDVVERLDAGATGDEGRYFVELALYHQDMHNEAFCYTRQTLGHANPFAAGTADSAAVLAHGDAFIPAGSVELGSRTGDGFIFDNEKWAHEVKLDAFSISRTAVSNAEYLRFVESGGYRRREFWDDAGWRWREQAGRLHPVYWRNSAGWQQRRFDAWRALEPELPVIHINAFEAEAYCRWAGRRLPTEAEWERAAATEPAAVAKRPYPWGSALPERRRANLASGIPVPVGALAEGDSAWGCRQMLGNVWEWTATVFVPYPGFSPDPYQDYSQPWFGTHRVLRGGSFATQPRLARNAYRNFYTPDRADVFAGFRTCAP